MTTAPEFTDPIAAPDAGALFEPPDPSRSGSKKGPEIPTKLRKVLGGMGQNKRTTPTGRPSRGAPRALTEEDRIKITDLYTTVGMFLMPIKPDVSNAILDTTRVMDPDTKEMVDGPTRAELCADAWMELAEENDSVRRVILFYVETGAWGKMFAANMPILIAALPDDAFARLFARAMPNVPAETMAPFTGGGFDATIVNGGNAG